jgi:hypothetical protein
VEYKRYAICIVIPENTRQNNGQVIKYFIGIVGEETLFFKATYRVICQAVTKEAVLASN